MLYGGAGADTFVYAAGEGNDTIKDFTDGEDVIDLSGVECISGFGEFTITADGDDVLIDFSAVGSGTIRLEDAADMEAADFNFYQPPPAEGPVDGM